jgi:hypothetical protein
MLTALRFIAISALLMPPTVIAQRPPRPTMPSNIPSRPNLNNEVYVPYWTLEPGWHTEIELRNNLKSSDLQVTPVVRTQAGMEITLPAVTVKPDEVKLVDLHAELSNARPEMVGRTGSYGSAVLRFISPGAENLYVGSMVHREGKPISFHFDGAPTEVSFNGGTTRETIWWLPNSSSEGHLIITNASSKPAVMNLILYNQAGVDFKRQFALAPRQMRRFSIRELVTEAHLSDESGGLRIEVQKGSESVYAAEIAFDETTGFSALLRMFERNPEDKIRQVTLRAPMMALSSPDPALFMPQETVLKPRVFLRNAAPEPLKLSASLRWRADDLTGVVEVGNFELAPNATQTIDISQLQENDRIPRTASWGTMTVRYQGRYGDLVSIAASYEKEGRYGLQTPFTPAADSHWVGSQWFSDPIRNSIITVGNATSAPTTANLTLHFNRGQNQYEVEQKLGPGEQIWVDVSKIIRNQIPDKSGRFIPLDVRSGSYSIIDKDHVLGPTLFEGKLTIDKTFGHASYGCAQCCNRQNPFMNPDPFSGTVGGTWWNNIFGYNCSSQVVNYSTYGYDWLSSDSGIATVDEIGFSEGISPGTTYFDTKIEVPSGLHSCLYAETLLSSSGSVKPTVQITGNNSIPMLAAGFQGSDSLTLTAAPNPGGGTYQWSVITGGTNVTLANDTLQNVIVKSVAVGAATIRVQYTVNGQTASGTKIVTVQKPSSLGVLSDDSSRPDCGVLPYNGSRREILYQVLDEAGQLIPAAGIRVAETLNTTSNSCNVANPSPTSGLTLQSGSFPSVDTLAMCSATCLPADSNRNPLGSCSIVVSQSWRANGFLVRNNLLAYQCSSIQVTPQ